MKYSLIIMLLFPSVVSADTIFDIRGPIGDAFRQARDSRTSSGQSLFDRLFNRGAPKPFTLMTKEECSKHLSTLMDEHEFTNKVSVFSYYNRPLYEFNLMDEAENEYKSWMKPGLLGLPKYSSMQITGPNYEQAIHIHRACAKNITVQNTKKVSITIKESTKICRQTEMKFEERSFYTYFCLDDRAAYISFGESPVY